jgi:hypothetical protein
MQDHHPARTAHGVALAALDRLDAQEAAAGETLQPVVVIRVDRRDQALE